MTQLLTRISRRVAQTLGLTRQEEWLRLRLVRRRPCEPGHLRPRDDLPLQDILGAADDDEWAQVSGALASYTVPDGTGGVNPGDRRAIYALARYLRPERVLEVGTHIGASTVHLALALERSGDPDARLLTIDVRDVNDPVERPWARHGSSASPREMVASLGLEGRVTFRTGSSMDYLRETDDRYDLVFLDGDHSAATVYREVLLALRLLRPGGCILLHDYFPGERPLWRDQRVAHGPALAVDRLRGECPALDVVPLGELPWPTKQGSRMTSLALVARRDAGGPVAG